MSPKPQFTLKDVFGVILVLSVPLGMIATGNRDVVWIGAYVLFPVAGGCIGHLAAAQAGMATGCVLAVVAGNAALFAAMRASSGPSLPAGAIIVLVLTSAVTILVLQPWEGAATQAAPNLRKSSNE